MSRGTLGFGSGRNTRAGSCNRRRNRGENSLPSTLRLGHRRSSDGRLPRSWLKVRAAIENARAFLQVQQERGSFDAFAWSFVGGKPLVNRPRSMADVPARTPESDAFSQALRERGFRFVGSTIVYAFMQACGLVDDHVRGCFRAKRR